MLASAAPAIVPATPSVEPIAAAVIAANAPPTTWVSERSKTFCLSSTGSDVLLFGFGLFVDLRSLLMAFAGIGGRCKPPGGARHLPGLETYGTAAYFAQSARGETTHTPPAGAEAVCVSGSGSQCAGLNSVRLSIP